MHYLAAQSTYFVYILTFLQKLCLQFMKRLAITCWNSMIFAFCIYTNFSLFDTRSKPFQCFILSSFHLTCKECRLHQSVAECWPVSRRSVLMSPVSQWTLFRILSMLSARMCQEKGARTGSVESWPSLSPVCSLLRTNNKSRMWIINILSGCPLQPRLPHPLLLLQDSLQVLLLDSRLFLV